VARLSLMKAIIKMDEEGAFSLNNIGKFSIFVNDKEVPAKKRINLLSHSLVKVRRILPHLSEGICGTN